jgi:hypothetical protein
MEDRTFPRIYRNRHDTAGWLQTEVAAKVELLCPVDAHSSEAIPRVFESCERGRAGTTLLIADHGHLKHRRRVVYWRVPSRLPIREGLVGLGLIDHSTENRASSGELLPIRSKLMALSGRSHRCTDRAVEFFERAHTWVD